jgi:hypothetical protein
MLRLIKLSLGTAISFLVLLGCEKQGAPVIIGASNPDAEINAQGPETPIAEPDEREPRVEKVPVKEVAIESAYLLCAQEKSATATDFTSRLNCGAFDEISRKKLDLKTILDKPLFSFDNPQKITVTLEDRINDPDWHVLVSLKANDLPQIENFLRDSHIYLKGNSLDTKQARSLEAALNKILALPIAGLDFSKGYYTQASSAALAGTLINNTDAQLACAGLSAADTGVHLGRFVATSSKCIFAFGTGIEESAKLVFIAKSIGGTWMDGANRSIPATAIPLGKEGNGQAQFLCRATVGTQGQIYGKIAAGYDGCNLISQGGYLQVTTYQVLSQ